MYEKKKFLLFHIQDLNAIVNEKIEENAVQIEKRKFIEKTE